jgi:hypothetical protein
MHKHIIRKKYSRSGKSIQIIEEVVIEIEGKEFKYAKPEIQESIPKVTGDIAGTIISEKTIEFSDDTTNEWFMKCIEKAKVSYTEYLKNVEQKKKSTEAHEKKLQELENYLENTTLNGKPLSSCIFTQNEDLDKFYHDPNNDQKIILLLCKAYDLPTPIKDDGYEHFTIPSLPEGYQLSLKMLIDESAEIFSEGINYLFCKDDKVLCEINCDDKLLLEMGGVKIVKEY